MARWMKMGLAALLAVSAGTAWAKGPVSGGGNLGLGLVIGEPDDWGITGKVWTGRSNAFQAALNVDGGTVLQADYLWHKSDVVTPRRGKMPLYLGVGGAIAFDADAFAVRGPVGFTYLFPTTPLDLFLELVPTLWFFDEPETTHPVTGEKRGGGSGTDFKLDAGFGARYYF